jgi:hypothetical protein
MRDTRGTLSPEKTCVGGSKEGALLGARVSVGHGAGGTCQRSGVYPMAPARGFMTRVGS